MGTLGVNKPVELPSPGLRDYNDSENRQHKVLKSTCLYKASTVSDQLRIHKARVNARSKGELNCI